MGSQLLFEWPLTPRTDPDTQPQVQPLWGLLNIYVSAENLSRNYVVSTNPSETLRCNLTFTAVEM